jgi:hypothetical protein
MGVLTVRKWGPRTTISAAQVDTFGGYQYELTDTEASIFHSYFEQYQITMIEAFFRPMFRANSVVQAADGNMPLIYVATDPDDISAWGTISAAQSVDRVIEMDDSEGFVVKFQPVVSTALYDGAFTAFANVDFAPWINTASVTVRHYGLKWAVTGSGVGAVPYQTWNVDHRYTVRFRLGK